MGEDNVGEMKYCGENAAVDSLLPKWDQEKQIKMYGGTSNSFLVKPQAYTLRLQQGNRLLRCLRSCPVYLEPDISSKVRLRFYFPSLKAR